MSTGQIKISGLNQDLEPTKNDLAITVDVETNSSKKVILGDLAKALDYTNSISTDSNNLIDLGSDEKIKIDVDNNLKSTDVGNVLQKGSDGKIFVPSIEASLDKDRMWIGGDTNTPQQKNNNEVKEFLGFSKGYIKDNITYISANEVSWKGECRDSSNIRDFILNDAIVATLNDATPNTTYNLFIASNTLTGNPVVIWADSNIPSGYTYYKRVLSIITDGLGNIVEADYYTNKSGSLRVVYNTPVAIAPNLTADVHTTSISIPIGINLGAILAGVVRQTGSGSSVYINQVGKSTGHRLGVVDNTSTYSTFNIENVKTNTGEIDFTIMGNTLTFASLETIGYIDERED